MQLTQQSVIKNVGLVEGLLINKSKHGVGVYESVHGFCFTFSV